MEPMRSCRVRALLVTLFCAGNILSQIEVPRSAPADLTKGAVSGRVYDADSGAPLANIEVRCGSIRARTDAEGRYALRGVPAGRSEIRVPSKFLYPPDPLASRYVLVTGQTEVSDINLRARIPGMILGRVLDENREPLQRIKVSVVSQLVDSSVHEFPGNRPRYGVWQQATTDDRGRYELHDLFAGTRYWVLAELERTYNASVSDADDQNLHATLPLTYYPNSTTLSSANPILLRSQERRENVDITMSHVPSHCLDAILMQGNTPASLAFAVVDLERVPRMNAQNGLPQMAGRSGPNGRIRVCDLYSGQFELTAISTSAVRELPDSVGRVRVAIPFRGGRMLSVSTSPPVTVSGEVTWEMEPAQNTPRPELAFGAAPQSHPVVSRVRVPGEFVFQAMPTLDYHLQIFSGLEPPFYVKDIKYGDSNILHTPIVPVSGEKLRILLGSDGGSINIVVHDDNGRLSANASIAVIPENQAADAVVGVILGRCDNGGGYIATALAPGRYYVLATQESLPYTPESLARIWSVRGEAEKVQLAANGIVMVSAVTKKVP